MKQRIHSIRPLLAWLVLLIAVMFSAAAAADETCNSPYMRGLIKGQEDFVHVWTLGVEGWGDGSDKLVTIDANPRSKTYGRVVQTVSVGGHGEAHHMGFTDDRRFLWAGRLDDSKIFVFDVGTDPSKPKLVKTISDLPARSGLVGPHTYYAMPGRMLVGNLSNTKDNGGATGLVVYNNKGDFVRKYMLPTGLVEGVQGDGYGYDIAINPGKNVLLTSSFTGRDNYLRDLGSLIKDAAAMKRFGNTMAVTAAALTSKLWLIRQGANGEWQAKEVATIGDPAKVPLPADISLRADGKGLWLNTFMDGTTRYFDLTNPETPKQTYAKQTGRQVNMISQSWDGKRVYITSSLLEHWDKAGTDNEQFLRAFNWDGKELTLAFEVDFAKEKLGRAHHMKFTARPSGVAEADAAPGVVAGY